jgi:GT2 family glycosyltransferase
VAGVPTEPGRPDVTVALLIHRPGAWEVETAEIVRAQRYPGRVVVHAIDSSPDPDAEPNRALREASDRWEAIPPASFGHATTRNLAASRAQTPVVVFLSQDAHPANDGWLEALVRPLHEGRAEAAYGRQVPPHADAERAATFGYLYPEQPQIKTKAMVPELGLTTFHFSDVTSAFLTDVVRRVGFPDVSIFEDVGIAKRLLDEGCRIAYEPDAVVVHSHPMGLRELVGRYRQIGSVYEDLGIFDELRASGRSLVRDGLSTARSVAPRAVGPTAKVRSALVGGLKLASVSYGRWEARSGRGGGRG